MVLMDSFNAFLYAYNKMLNNYCKNDCYNEITAASYQYLMAIFDSKQITVTKLAGNLGIKKASVTQMIDSLMSKGYVEKVKCSCDKRSAFIKLTDKGENLIESENAVYKAFTERIGKTLTLQETEQLEALLIKLTKEVQEFDI